MSVDPGDDVCVDLDAVARLTAATDRLASVAADCARELAATDLCRWADDGPIRRHADATARRLRILADDFRVCGVAADAAVTDLGRAITAFTDAEDAATAAVTGWAR